MDYWPDKQIFQKAFPFYFNFNFIPGCIFSDESSFSFFSLLTFILNFFAILDKFAYKDDDKASLMLFGVMCVDSKFIAI